MEQPKKKTEITGRCPQCKKQIKLSNNPFKPFCSERCKMVDLGAWFTEKYVIKKEDNEEQGDK